MSRAGNSFKQVTFQSTLPDLTDQELREKAPLISYRPAEQPGELSGSARPAIRLIASPTSCNVKDSDADSPTATAC